MVAMSVEPQGGGKQRQQHGRLDEHAHEQLANAADAGVGVGRIHTAEGEEEAGERQAVHDGDGVTKDRDGALCRKERQTHREHKGDGEEQRMRSAKLASSLWDSGRAKSFARSR